MARGIDPTAAREDETLECLCPDSFRDAAIPVPYCPRHAEPCGPGPCEHPAPPCEGGMWCRCPQSTPCLPYN